MLILTGPQGSGNHVFARLFSMHPEVKGWEELKTTYWVKHNRDELAECWLYPQLLKKEYFDDYKYFVTDVSFPFNFDGVRYNPKIIEFATKVKGWGIDVTFGIITRDEGINRLQQDRVRSGATLEIAKNYFINNLLRNEFPIHFISLESFFSYKLEYLKYLEKLLDFPIGYNEPDILRFIEDSPNLKYIRPVDYYWLDEYNNEGVAIEDLLNSENRENDN